MKQKLLVPSDLRNRLEMARLDLLALFRALDRLTLTAHEIPQEELHGLFELDADFAEALDVMDNPPPFPINNKAMVRDTVASLNALPQAQKSFFRLLPVSSRPKVTALQKDIRNALAQHEAYHSIPSRDPQSC
jgi:hypothetical protein